MFDLFTSLIGRSSNPARAGLISIFSSSSQNLIIKNLSVENDRLRSQVLDQQKILLENKALKDQFGIIDPKPENLIPVKIVGRPGFIPGLTLPDHLIIDVGRDEKIEAEDTLVLGNNLVGKVIEVSGGFAKVELLTNKNSSFTASVFQNDGTGEISGIIRGEGSDKLVLGNVLLKEDLKKNQLVLTKGDKNDRGRGYPPGLVVGKIVSVEKKSSELFQKGEVVSFIDFSNLRSAFVLK